MDEQQWMLVLINVIGGAAVLGSYYRGLKTHPDQRSAVWGGVPEGLKPFYTVSMSLAAAGYFAFTYFILFEIETDDVEIWGQSNFGPFLGTYAVILFASALWMPLTFRMIKQPSKTKWCAIRIVLGTVGIASLALLATLISLDPRQPQVSYWLAVIGTGLFCVQTSILDATVWPAYFSSE